ncbi:NUDIX hydrolase [Planomonospora sphaerica]|uniref:NUDIX hydrolase n=1 Tax=Planomonospora sphaerica TaxID=161355 RepID=A0A171CQ21_9ACTN|nr:NUDIX domain-containing protein [Planomonospora sphaerica]GAT67049.1 NUDIX hydrolase [Planomonospora sphaerica]
MPTGSTARAAVRDLVAAVEPYDLREAAHQAWMLEWIDSGAQLFRLEKPSTPPRHLAVYAVLIDDPTRSIMIVDHLLAQAWLFPGGHVDDLEDPRSAVCRELMEELRISPAFHPQTGDIPFFLTVTRTRGRHSHTDVTLWFCYSADRNAPITPDRREFGEVQWVPIDDRHAWPDGAYDPGLERFLGKLRACLDGGGEHRFTGGLRPAGA